MIQNDEEKSWMLPLLDFRNYIAAYNQGESQDDLDRKRRDFRRMTGNLTWHNDRLVHGPYKKEVREEFLRRLLRLQIQIRQSGPENVREANLITHEELCYIRKLWLDEKHEFDDALPRIYKEETGEVFQDNIIKGNKYYGQEEWDLLNQVCEDKYPDYTLMLELQSTLLDMEAKNSAINSKKNILKKLEEELKRAYYKNEDDAEQKILERRRRQGLEPIPEDEEILPEDLE